MGLNVHVSENRSDTKGVGVSASAGGPCDIPRLERELAEPGPSN